MNLIGLALAGLIALFATGASAQMTEEQRAKEIEKLNFERGGTHKLSASSSTLAVPEDHAVLLGTDASRFERLVGNASLADVEAVVINQSYEQVLFQSVREGYVSIDDWKDI